MMRKLTGVLMILVAIVAVNCSEDKTPTQSLAHDTGWTDPGSELFHANKVTVSGAVSCRSCHGQNVDSGEENTFCQNCHKDHLNATYPHRQDWNIIGDPDNHGNYMKSDGITPHCINCHGDSPATIAGSCSRCHIGS